MSPGTEKTWHDEHQNLLHCTFADMEKHFELILYKQEINGTHKPNFDASRELKCGIRFLWDRSCLWRSSLRRAQENDHRRQTLYPHRNPRTSSSLSQRRRPQDKRFILDECDNLLEGGLDMRRQVQGDHHYRQKGRMFLLTQNQVTRPCFWV